MAPPAAGTINAATGVMDWDAAFFGTATITCYMLLVSATTTTADRAVTVNPSTGPVNFTLGATTVCQDAANETYTATAANSTSMAYSVAPHGCRYYKCCHGCHGLECCFQRNGYYYCYCYRSLRNYNCRQNCYSQSFNRSCKLHSRCQLLSARMLVTRLIQPLLLTALQWLTLCAPPAAGTINAATGVMDWDAAFSGTATITANATGLCGNNNCRQNCYGQSSDRCL
ncbi:MAG: hypothetical protein MZU84_00040 [Sphingobacterium sp.]|nr:hypothetical protein [Sphingobacterium sp.]